MIETKTSVVANRLAATIALQSSIVRSPSGCWEWQGVRYARGYGRILIEGQDWRAHRLSFAAFIGDIPTGMLVCHKCDNPPCVNPEHLWLGTPRDNVQDMFLKGRQRIDDRQLRSEKSRGELNVNATVAESDVLEMRAAYLAGAKVKDLAQSFGITPAQAGAITRGRSWKHLTTDVARGESRGNRRLTDETVVAIRVSRSEGESEDSIADRFGIKPSTVGAIAKGACRKRAGGPLTILRGRRATNGNTISDSTAVEIIRRKREGQSNPKIARELGLDVRRVQKVGIYSKLYIGDLRTPPDIAGELKKRRAAP